MAANAHANCSSYKSKSKKKQFRWAPDMVDMLITSLHNYKSLMEYKNVDFDGDRPMQYSWLREEMAKHFHEENQTTESENLGLEVEEMFGPVNVSTPNVSIAEMTKEEKDQHMKIVKKENENIKKGYGRIKEKVKEIRQSFSQAVTTGSRSGSGKIVFEHYERLVSLWGGSASTEPLPFGVDSDTYNKVDSDHVEGSVNEFQSDVGMNSSWEDVEDDEIEEGGKSEREDVHGKRKSESQVPKLIDNKRKHLQKSLSAAQRDQLLLNEAKEDNQMKKDLASAMRESTDAFSKALGGMNNSMVQLGAGICRSLEVMAHAMMTPAPTNQNLFYQNQPAQSGIPFHIAPTAAPNRHQNPNYEEEPTYSQLF